MAGSLSHKTSPLWRWRSRGLGPASESGDTLLTTLDDGQPRDPPGRERLWRGLMRAGVGGLLVAGLLVLGAAIPATWRPATVREGALLLALGALAAGAVATVLMLRGRLQAQVVRAARREDALRRMVHVAADAVWEVDAGYRLVALEPREGPSPFDERHGIGCLPWELPGWQPKPEVLDQLLADLDARQPLRGVAVSYQTSQGMRHFLLSGVPRFDTAGKFIGYRGVLQDMTAVAQAERHWRATETRYRELFARLPTPLVLHRHGWVLEVNDAAQQFFEAAGLPPRLSGQDLLAWYEAGDSRERARRSFDQLAGHPNGSAVPSEDFRLQLPSRRLAVRASSVCVEVAGAPATLTCFIDETERLAAGEAAQHAESLKAHLLATTPDLITLTELHSGRYTLVNRAFERISGWSAAEAVGRTVAELGIWPGEEAREAFIAQVQREGRVQEQVLDFRNRQGEAVRLLVSAARFQMDGSDYLVLAGRDITDKERERQEREAILHNAAIGIAVTRQGRLVLANRQFAGLFGRDARTLMGEETAQLWPLLWGPEAQAQVLAAEMAETAEVAEQASDDGQALEVEGLRLAGGALTRFKLQLRTQPVDPQQPAAGLLWLAQDVSQQRAFEATLAAARDAAEAANRAKSAFLANTSHELRTPLHGLLGLAQLARDEGMDPARRRHYLDQIETTARSLAALLGDVLDLARLDTGRLSLENTVFDLGDELTEVHLAHRALAEPKGLALDLALHPSSYGLAHGDPLRLRQIVGHFLVNAVKFTRRGRIELRARRIGPAGDPRVRIEVEDSGVGLTPAEQARLFQPFAPGDDSATRQSSGIGLGLSLCRQLAQLMGGDVGVVSVPGQGSTFWLEVVLPAVGGNRPPESDPRRRSTGRLAEHTHDQPAPRTATELAPPPAPPLAADIRSGVAPSASAAPAPLRGLRVLMVEDNAVNMLIAAALLEMWGIEVVQAQDGEEALLAVQRANESSRPFDLVLMDVQMPVMSGHEATRRLRALEAEGSLRTPDGRVLPRLPIIALTAAALAEERDQALASGMDDFLTKPIDAGHLRSALQRWLRRV